MNHLERRLVRAEEQMQATIPKETPLAIMFREIIIMNRWKRERNLTVQEAIRRGELPPGIRPSSLELMAKVERKHEAETAARRCLESQADPRIAPQ